jgi:hypothetical protein
MLPAQDVLQLRAVLCRADDEPLIYAQCVPLDQLPRTDEERCLTVLRIAWSQLQKQVDEARAKTVRETLFGSTGFYKALQEEYGAPTPAAVDLDEWIRFVHGRLPFGFGWNNSIDRTYDATDGVRLTVCLRDKRETTSRDGIPYSFNIDLETMRHENGQAIVRQTLRNLIERIDGDCERRRQDRKTQQWRDDGIRSYACDDCDCTFRCTEAAFKAHDCAGKAPALSGSLAAIYHQAEYAKLGGLNSVARGDVPTFDPMESIDRLMAKATVQLASATTDDERNSATQRLHACVDAYRRNGFDAPACASHFGAEREKIESQRQAVSGFLSEINRDPAEAISSFKRIGSTDVCVKHLGNQDACDCNHSFFDGLTGSGGTEIKAPPLGMPYGTYPYVTSLITTGKPPEAAPMPRTMAGRLQLLSMLMRPPVASDDEEEPT